MARDQVLTLAEAARMIRVSRKTLGEMARQRRVPARKVGREWRFLRSALDEWLVGFDDPNPRDRSLADRTTVNESAPQYELRLAGFRDTAFSDNHKRQLHRWVPWIAGFSSSFVTGVLETVRKGDESLRVLDPFAGVGTTLVEAIRSADTAVGFEINPYAALACRVKARAAVSDASELEAAIEHFEDYTDDKLWQDKEPRAVPPPGFKSRVPFFSPNVERQVLACLDFIREQTSGWVADVFRLALGSVMVSFSNYSYEPSLGTRAGAGRPNIEQADVPEIVGNKLREILEDMLGFQREVGGFDRPPVATLHPVSYLEHANRIEPHSIDLMITSPPYLNNYHYIRNTRPQLFWLDLVQSTTDLKDIERQSFGQFWQTVRTGPEIPLQPDLEHLVRKLRRLRSCNADKGAYGGPGWANYATSYFNDCQRFCQVTRAVMRPGGTVVVVIGNNILQGIEFETDRLFANIAEAEGFQLVDIHMVRTKRTGNSVINSSVRAGKVARPVRLYETAVELRAP